MGTGKVVEINAVDTLYSSSLYLLLSESEHWIVTYIEGIQSVQVRIILEGYTKPDHISTGDIREENNMVKTNKTYLKSDVWLTVHRNSV